MTRTTVLAALGAAVSIAGTGLVATAGSWASDPIPVFACRVNYTANDWGTGFGATVIVSNLGASAINGWTLTYSYTGNQTLQQGWMGIWSQSDKKITVANADWNGTIPINGRVSSGANFSYSGSNAKPTDFAINGTACVGLPPTTTTHPTTITTGTPP